MALDFHTYMTQLYLSNRDGPKTVFANLFFPSEEEQAFKIE